MAKFKVIIIGAGLAGSLLANGLINNDIEVQVYDRLERHSRKDGYQIRIGASALMGLRACLLADHLAKIVHKFGRASGKASSAPVIFDSEFKILLNLGRFPVYDKSTTIGRGVLRDALADPVEEAGKLLYKKAFVRYEVLNNNTSTERIRVWFSDETFDDCDLLVGADGSHSKINQQVGLNNIKQLESHWAFLSKAQLPTQKFLSMSKELRETPIIVASNNRTMYFCAYLPDKSTNPADSGQAKRLGTREFDEDVSSCFFAWALPENELPADFNDFSLEQKWDFIAGQFKIFWSPKFGEIIDIIQGCDLYIYKPRASSRPPQNWRSKVKSAQSVECGHPRVVLIGDAIHAMLTGRGQGGNQAMRDTSVLLPILIRLADKAKSETGITTAEIARGCKEYEDEMIPRAFTWVKKSGGHKIIPFDTSKISGRAILVFLGIAMDVVYAFYWFAGLFVKRQFVDDAPELQT